MRTAAICPTCATFTNALCVIYDGEYLENIDVSPMDNLEDIIVNINNNLVPVHAAGAPTTSAVYIGQLYVNDTNSDLYFADDTGGGSGDWIEIYTTTNPPSTPGINSVLAVNQSLTAAREMNVVTFSYKIKSTAYTSGLFGVSNSGEVYMGDKGVDVNGTVVNVDDVTEEVTIVANNWAKVNGNPIAVSVNGVTADLSGNVNLYSVYTAVISQTGITAPTVDYTLQNTLGFTPTFAYVSPGIYTISSTLAWVNNKTVVFLNPGIMPTGVGVDAGVALGWERNSSSQITLKSKKTSDDADTDGLIDNATIEIRIYP